MHVRNKNGNIQWRSPNTPIPHRPRIARIATNGFFYWFGGIREVSLKKNSPIVMVYESVPIQIGFRHEYSGESAQFGLNRTRIHYE